MMKRNFEIDNFIQDTLVVDKDKGEMLVFLRRLVSEIAPEAEEEIKYGGLVFMINETLNARVRSLDSAELKSAVADNCKDLFMPVLLPSFSAKADKRLFCGVFIRKVHISVEFDRGAEIQDTENILEGSGKYRRHVKLFGKDDIENKKVEYYIRQCFKL